ncbi:MAG: hypothetical protein ACM34H_07290 [Deltaproteobacteria bacterium]
MKPIGRGAWIISSASSPIGSEFAQLMSMFVTHARNVITTRATSIDNTYNTRLAFG